MSCRLRQGQGENEDLPQAPSKPKLRKGLWSQEEDQNLIAYILDNGTLGCSWASVAKQAGLERCGKSCRLRWVNYLRRGLKRGAFSRQEEQLIIKLQSIIGNRWALIAAHIPGRTDNEIKNYWNSSIKKKLKLKYHFSNTNSKCNARASRCDRICRTDSLVSHTHDDFTSSRSAQPYLDAMPERYQTRMNTLNAVTTGENQFCDLGVLELKQEQVVDQNDDINQLISYFQYWIDDASTLHSTHESVSSHAAFQFPSLPAQGLLHTCNTTKSPTCNELIIESCRTTVPPVEAPGSANYSLGSIAITTPAAVEAEFLKEKIENDGSSTSQYSCSNPTGYHCPPVVDPGAYIVHEAGISIVEDYESLYDKTTHQAACPQLSFLSQFGAHAIKWPVGHFNDFQAENDCRDRLDLRYDLNLGIPKYIYNDIKQRSCGSLQINGGGEIGDQREFSIIPHEEANENPIPRILGGGGSAEFEFGDDIYNLSTVAVSDLDEIYFS